MEIGPIRSVQPARRKLRVAPLPGRGRHLTQADWVEAVLRDGSHLRCRVESARELAGLVVVTLTAGVTRDTVARLRGATVLADVDDEAPVDRGASRLEDLVGLSVLDRTGKCLGTVATVYSAGTNEVFEVAKCGGGSMLLPAIQQVIGAVDLDKGAMVLNDVAPYAVEHED